MNCKFNFHSINNGTTLISLGEINAVYILRREKECYDTSQFASIIKLATIKQQPYRFTVTTKE
jgi:hypothetical protein